MSRFQKIFLASALVVVGFGVAKFLGQPVLPTQVLGSAQCSAGSARRRPNGAGNRQRSSGCGPCSTVARLGNDARRCAGHELGSSDSPAAAVRKHACARVGGEREGGHLDGTTYV